jgi:hypothetical protein
MQGIISMFQRTVHAPSKWVMNHCRRMRQILLAIIAGSLGGALSAAEPNSGSVRPISETGVIAVDPGRGEFTLVLLPDTQRYTKFNPAMYFSQTHWIRDNRGALNLQFVIHLGDIIDDNTDAEWRVADMAMRVLDEHVPYIVLPGNHDFEPHPEKGWRMKLSPKYNAVFSPLRFRDKPWYGGHRGITNDNSYCFFSAAGREFMIVALEYGPTDEVLEWAAALIRAHPHKRVIVATHSYMYDDDTRLGPGDEYSPHKSHLSYNDGEQMWEKFIRHHRNIFMVVSGHVKGRGTGRLTSKGDHGNVVHQMLSNYQQLESGGDGWLRILKFIPGEKKLLVRTYSPWLKKFDHDPNQSFDLELEPSF